MDEHVPTGCPPDQPSARRANAEGEIGSRPEQSTLRSIRGVVPPLSGRASIDVEDRIEEAMEEEADRIVSRMGHV